MTFFYDMNKRLAEIDKNNKSVKQLNEAFVPPKLEEPDEKVEIDMPSGTNFNFSSTRPGDFIRTVQSQGGRNSFVSTEPGDLARAFKPGQYQRTAQDFDLPDEDLREMMRLSGLSEDDMEEGNEFSGARADAMAAGEKTFAVDGRTYPVKEGAAEASLASRYADDPTHPSFRSNASAKKEFDYIEKNLVTEGFKKSDPEADDFYNFANLYSNPDSRSHPDPMEAVRLITDQGKDPYVTTQNIISFGKSNPDEVGYNSAVSIAFKDLYRTFIRYTVLTVIEEIKNDAMAGQETIDDLYDLAEYHDDVQRIKDRTLSQAYAHMRQKGGDAEGNPQKMALIAQQAIGMLSPQVAQQVIGMLRPVAEGKQRVNIGKKLGEGKKRRPDFPDLDNDGNTTEPISQAAKDAARGRKIAGKAYGGAAQKDDAEDNQEQPRRRGRPDEGGPKHTYNAPFGKVKVPAWKGPRTVHKIGDAEPGKEAPRRGRPKKVSEEMIDRPDPNEYDREGEMAKTQLRTASDAADELRSILDSDENLPEWVQSKITKAVDYLDTARDYMKSTDSKELEPIAERPRSENQRIAAAIALKAKREGHRPKPGTASAEMAGMSEKELKKFAKKPKGETLPKRVKETTTSGSVTVSDATADNSAKPKKSKSGVTFGKGIYDSWNRELEVMISEAMDISVNQTTQDDGTIKKTINVNATDEDAEKLADLLNLAGLDQHDDDHTCPVCGQEPCECAEMVDENSPNWPTSTEYNEDSLQYSGGLNGPKSTGQTTVPIIASQLDRQIAESDDLMAQELDRIRKFIGK